MGVGCNELDSDYSKVNSRTKNVMMSLCTEKIVETFVFVFENKFWTIFTFLPKTLKINC